MQESTGIWKSVRRTRVLSVHLAMLKKTLAITCCDATKREELRHSTHDTLKRCIVKYVRKRGNETMCQIAWGEGNKFWKLGKSMDHIVWRRYTEGMISKEVLVTQAEYTAVGAGSMTTSN